MKNVNLLSCFLIMSFLIVTGMLNNLAAQTTYYPSDDSYVKNDASAHTSGESILRTKIGSTFDNSNNRKLMIAFDLKDVDFSTSTISRAILKLTCSDVAKTADDIIAYELDNAWIKDASAVFGDITFGNEIATTYVDATAEFLWDVTSYIADHATDDTISIGVNSSSLNTDFDFNSLETGTTTGPKLVITTSSLVLPNAPSNLAGTALSTTEIDLSWTDNAIDEEGFILERKEGTDAFTQIAVLGVDETTYSDVGLTPTTEYTYRILAYNGTGNSAYSATATVSTNTFIVESPTALSATALSSSEIDLSWTDNSSDELGFKIERQTGDGAFSEIAVLAADVTSYSDVDLEEAVVYTYRVAAYKAEGNSDFIEAATAVTFRTTPGTVALAVTEDAYVRGGSNSTVNYGSSVELMVKTASSAKNTRQSVLKFDLSKAGYLSNDVDKAVVRLYSHNTSPCYITASELEDGWDESTVTWDLLPTIGDSLTSTLIDLEGKYYEWDVTAYVKAELEGDNVVSLLFSDNRDSVLNVDFHSKESGTFVPELAITINNDNLQALPVAGDARLGYWGSVTYANNYGDNDDIRARYDANVESNNDSYLKFDISSVTFAREEAYLKLFAYDLERATEISLFGSNDQIEWDESTISGYNNPLANMRIGTYPLTSESEILLDVTDYVNKAVTEGWTELTLVVKENEGAKIYFYSKEASSNQPELLVSSIADTYTAPTILTGTYYIDADAGNDSNDGTSEGAAWKNISALQDMTFGPGASILLKSGSTWNVQQLSFNGSGSQGSPIIIGSYGSGDKPLIAGNGLLNDPIHLYNQEYLEISDLHITNMGATMDGLRRGIHIVADNFGALNHIHVTDCKFADINGTDGTIDGVYGNSDDEKRSGAIIFEVRGDDVQTYYNDMLFEGNYFREVSNTGIANNSHWTDLLFDSDWSSNTVPGTEKEHFVHNFVPSTNIVMSRNRFDTIYSQGIIIRTAENPIMEYNLFYYCSYGTGSDNACFNSKTTGAIWRYNEACFTQYTDGTSDGSGFDSDLRTKNTLIEYNYSHDNGYGGIISTGGSNEGSFNDSTIVRYNILANNGDNSLRVCNQNTNLLAYNNLIYQDVTSENSLFFSHLSSTTPSGPLNSFVHNNIFYTTNDKGKFTSDVDEATDTRFEPVKYSNNLYYGIIAEYQYPDDVNKVTADPLFDDGTLPVASDIGGYLLLGSDGVPTGSIDYTYLDGFNLQSTSSAIDAGLISDVAVLPYVDFANNSVYNATAIDIGPFEYGATNVAIPNSPTALNASVISSSQIDLSWTDNADDELGYKVERSQDLGSFIEVAELAADAVSFSDTDLDEYTEYTYRVIAYNEGGESAYSNQMTARTLINPPADPTDLVASGISTSEIELVWVDNASNEEGYIIERKVDDEEYAELALIKADSVLFIDEGLRSSTTYSYRVRAYHLSDSSNYSNEDTATTFVAAILEPTDLVAVATSISEVELTWVDNADNENGFKIERKEESGEFAEIAELEADVKSYSDSGLEASTTYVYRVRAYNSLNNSNYSNEATTITFIAPILEPSELEAIIVSASELSLSWTDNSDNEDGFKIERQQVSSTVYDVIATVAADVTSYNDEGLSETQEYSYRVFAFNADTISAYSNILTISTGAIVPTDPTDLSAVAASNSAIDLSWADNANNEDGYKVERESADGTFEEIADLDADAVSYSNTGLSEATEYTYRVVAYNAVGNSEYSNEVSETTLVALPTDPTDLVATAVSISAIDLVWIDNATNETGYKIERKDESGSFAEIAELAANVVSYSDMDLIESTLYTYRVVAYNSMGNSAYSNESSDTTFTSDGTSVEDIHFPLANIRVYPNPTNGVFTIDCDDLEVKQIAVLDLSGKLVLSNDQVSSIETIDLSSFTSNVYIVKVVTVDGVYIEKVIID